MRTLLNWSEERNGGKSLTDASAKIAKGVWGLFDAFFEGAKRKNDAVGFTQEQSAPNWVVLYFVIFCFGVFSKKQSYVFSKGPVKAQRRRLSGKVVNIKDVWDSFPFLAGLKNCDCHSTILRGTEREDQKKKKKKCALGSIIVRKLLESDFTDASLRGREILERWFWCCLVISLELVTNPVGYHASTANTVCGLTNTLFFFVNSI